MRAETIKKIKTDLLHLRKEIEKALKAFATKNSDHANDFISAFPNYGEESDENAQEVEQYSTNLATEQVLEKNLRDIDAALKKIEQGTYGICKYCGHEISEKRLLARPTASSCIDCKTKLQG